MKEQGLCLYVFLISMVQEENQRLIRVLGMLDMDPAEWANFALDAVNALYRTIANPGVSPKDVLQKAITTTAILMKISEMFLKLDMQERLKEKTMVRDSEVGDYYSVEEPYKVTN